MIQVPDFGEDFSLIDFGNGEKLERWGKYIIRRPDQNALGKMSLGTDKWNKSDLKYKRISKEEGKWESNVIGPQDKWQIRYYIGNVQTNPYLSFWIKPTKYKHLGLFPEQAVNWEWIIKTIRSGLRNDSSRSPRVLNLFAYTGGATLAASLAGASEVVHVDSSKSVNTLAKENQKLSGLEKNNIRFITEDARKFVLRELKRGNKYDAIIMDPPLYGRGSNGELWKIDNDLLPLIDLCLSLLSSAPLFFVVNLYAGSSIEKTVVSKLQKWADQQLNMQLDVQSLGLQVENKTKILPCGDVVRCF